MKQGSAESIGHKSCYLQKKWGLMSPPAPTIPNPFAVWVERRAGLGRVVAIEDLGPRWFPGPGPYQSCPWRCPVSDACQNCFRPAIPGSPAKVALGRVPVFRTPAKLAPGGLPAGSAKVAPGGSRFRSLPGLPLTSAGSDPVRGCPRWLPRPLIRIAPASDRSGPVRGYPRWLPADLFSGLLLTSAGLGLRHSQGSGGSHFAESSPEGSDSAGRNSDWFVPHPLRLAPSLCFALHHPLRPPACRVPFLSEARPRHNRLCDFAETPSASEKDRFGHMGKLSWKPSRTKQNLPVDNEDIGYNFCGSGIWVAGLFRWEFQYNRRL
jgi:hypothetical protein